MAGAKALRKIQLGKETTAGTAVAATAIWRGTGVGKDNRTLEFPEEDVGLLMPPTRVYTPKYEFGLSMDETPATFEQVGYIFEAGVESETPAADGAGSGKIYTYNIATTAQNTIKTYTIEWGDDQQAEESAYCFVTEFAITGEAGGAVMVSAEWMGRTTATTTYTSPISLPTIEEILFGTGALYIDDTSTYPATTAKSNTLLSMNLELTTGMMGVFTADELYFTFKKQVAPEGTLEIVFEHDATAVAEIAKWRAETARAVRLQFTGSNVTTAGTTYSAKQFIIDLCGHWESFEMGDQDGNDIMTGVLRIGYDATATATGRFIVVNELSALP